MSRPCAPKRGRTETTLARYTADPTALDVLGGGLIDSAHTIRAVSDLEGSAGELDRVADETRSEVSAMRRELAPLDSGSSLATAADIELVCERLGAVGIGALTAWSWLTRARRQAGRADALIASRPDLVNAVVVTDPTRLGAAKAALADLANVPRLAVLVSTTDFDAVDLDTSEPGVRRGSAPCALRRRVAGTPGGRGCPREAGNP